MLARLAAPILILCLAVAPAMAKPTKAEKSQASDLYGEGVEHMKAQRYKEAATSFMAAYKLDPDPRLLWNIARAHEESEDWKAAKKWFQDLLAAENAPAKLRKAGLERVRNVDKKLAELAEAEAKAEAAEKERKLKEQLAKQKAEQERLRKERERLKREGKIIGSVVQPPGTKPPEKDPGLMIGGWTSVGVGAAAGIVAIVLHLQAESDRSRVLEPNETDLGGGLNAVTSISRKDALAVGPDADALDTGALVSTIVGGAALAVGVALLLADATSEPPVTEEKKVDVVAAPTAGGGFIVGAGGRF